MQLGPRHVLLALLPGVEVFENRPSGRFDHRLPEIIRGLPRVVFCVTYLLELFVVDGRQGAATAAVVVSGLARNICFALNWLYASQLFKAELYGSIPRQGARPRVQGVRRRDLAGQESVIGADSLESIVETMKGQFTRGPAHSFLGYFLDALAMQRPFSCFCSASQAR